MYLQISTNVQTQMYCVTKMQSVSTQKPSTVTVTSPQILTSVMKNLVISVLHVQIDREATSVNVGMALLGMECTLAMRQQQLRVRNDIHPISGMDCRAIGSNLNVILPDAGLWDGISARELCAPEKVWYYDALSMLLVASQCTDSYLLSFTALQHVRY